MSQLRNIAVAGHGVEAWIVAAGLRRAFRARPLDVRVVATPAQPARIGRWTLPSQRGMHSLLGVNESTLLAQTGATFKLATEHFGWQGEGSRWLHAHGDIGAEMAGTPFYKFLLNELLAGRRQAPESFSLAGTAATLGKFARPMGEGRALTAGFTYGFHLDEAGYSRFLRAHALGLGATETSAPLRDVRVGENGCITGLVLADGAEITADYYVDCSGAAASLMSRVTGDDREDWSAWLPCDRMWSATAPALDDPPALTRTFAGSAGWRWRAPLAAGSLVGHVFASRFEDEAVARAELQAFEPRAGEPVLTSFSAGRRRRFWAGNCVAVGESSVALEPLAGAELHLAQLGLARFLELFPLDRASTIEADEYNRVMAEHADALRDFTLAHYRVATVPGAFWDAVRSKDPPARLAERLDLYGAGGRINLHDHETFEETDWAWLLLGGGRTPDSLELQIRLQIEKFSAQEIGALRDHVKQLAASMPRHLDFVRRVQK